MTDVCGASSSSVCSSRSLRAATCSSGSWTCCTCCMHRQGGWTKRNAYKTSSKSRQGFKCFSTISVLVKLWTFVQWCCHSLGCISWSTCWRPMALNWGMCLPTSYRCPWGSWALILQLLQARLGNLGSGLDWMVVNWRMAPKKIYMYGQLRNGKDVSVLKFFLLLLVIQER